MGAVVNQRRRAFEAAQANSVGGLLTRLDLLVQRHGADVIFQHTDHRWVLRVQWRSEDGVSDGHVRVEGRSAVAVLTDALDRLRA